MNACIPRLALPFVLLSCRLAAELLPVLPDLPHNYANPAFPAHYLTHQIPGNSPFQTAAIANDSTPVDNPITDDGATLGRVLFYDRKLSANGTVSCGSCHDPDHGFADERVLSLGFQGGTTRRHSMALTNARFNASGGYFWDERARTLEDQVLMPFQDSTEMGLTLEQLVSIISAQDYYPALFTHAFGSDAINADRIARALAQFVRSMVSVESRYDQGRATVSDPVQPFPNFTAEENLGKNLFFNTGGGVSCVDCHTTEAFISPGFNTPHASTTTGATNNGLDRVSTTDLGIAETTGNVADTGRFRVPSLRNVASRPPFMHDGRFNTLRQVMDFYATAIQPHAQLAQVLRAPGGQVVRFRLNNNERNALVAFLRTLTDDAMLTAEKFGNPFAEVTASAPEPATRAPVLANLSSRSLVRPGDGALVSGFVVAGDQPKTLLIRGIGPELASYGITDVLAEPSLRLYSGQTEIARANRWADQTNASEIAAVATEVGAFALKSDRADTAMLVTVSPGAYTTHLVNAGERAGTGLIEIYDTSLGVPDASRLANLSVRAELSPGGELLVPGFVVAGDAPRTFLIRAVGPALSEFGVTSPVSDPRLTVISNGAIVSTNDNWTEAGNAAQIEVAAQTVGAFALPVASLDAATTISLPPGAYTVHVDSTDGAGGTCLIEIYPVDL